MIQNADQDKENMKKKWVKKGREQITGEVEQQMGDGGDSRANCIKVESSRISPIVGVASQNWTQIDK